MGPRSKIHSDMLQKTKKHDKTNTAFKENRGPTANLFFLPTATASCVPSSRHCWNNRRAQRHALPFSSMFWGFTAKRFCRSTGRLGQAVKWFLQWFHVGSNGFVILYAHYELCVRVSRICTSNFGLKTILRTIWGCKCLVAFP